MARVKRYNCAIEGCKNGVTVRGRLCLSHQQAARQAEIDALVDEHEKARQYLGLPATWGCLDPECEICS